jgi:3-hydroxymyristoyl/3-hydroxydecanoyl-(acyl carrier protein) dehydratase
VPNSAIFYWSEFQVGGNFPGVTSSLVAWTLTGVSGFTKRIRKNLQPSTSCNSGRPEVRLKSFLQIENMLFNKIVGPQRTHTLRAELPQATA